MEGGGGGGGVGTRRLNEPGSRLPLPGAGGDMCIESLSTIVWRDATPLHFMQGAARYCAQM